MISQSITKTIKNDQIADKMKTISINAIFESQKFIRNNNEFEDISKEEQQKIQEEYENNEDLVVYVYDKFELTASFVNDAVWEIQNKTTGISLDIDAIIRKEDNTTVATIQLMNGKTGEFDVIYGGSRIKHVVVKSI